MNQPSVMTYLKAYAAPSASVALALLTATAGTLTGDSLWYWIARAALLTSLAVVAAQVVVPTTPTPRQAAWVAMTASLVADAVIGATQFAGRSPLGLVVALIAAGYGTWRSFSLARPVVVPTAALVIGWALWVTPVVSAATLVISAAAVLAPAAAAAVILVPRQQRRTLLLAALAVWMTALLACLQYWSTGVANFKLSSQWYGLAVAATVFTAIGSLLSLVLRSERAKRTTVGLVVALGALAGTFTTAEADSTPRSAPIAIEESRTGSGMTGEKGAGPKVRYQNVSFIECDLIDKRDCFITYYDTLAKKYGVAAAVADIVEKTRFNEGANFPKHCHQTVHNLGQLAMELTGYSFDDTIALAPEVCGTGFPHGLFETAMVDLGPTKLFSEGRDVCDNLGMNNDFYQWTCHHILGHMMMMASMDNPSEAMEYCLNLKTDPNIIDCLAGGWMNFFQDDSILDYVGSRNDVKKLFEVCYGAQAGQIKVLCYQELFPAIYRILNGDDLAAGKACAMYSEPSDGKGDPWSLWSMNYADRCAQGLARAVAVGTDYDYRRVPPRCLVMPKSVQDACLTAAAGSVVSNTGALDAGIAVCKYVSDRAYRNYCMFWVRDAYIILTQGPNIDHLPQAGEIRLPGLAPGIRGELEIVKPGGNGTTVTPTAPQRTAGVSRVTPTAAPTESNSGR